MKKRRRGWRGQVSERGRRELVGEEDQRDNSPEDAVTESDREQQQTKKSERSARLLLCFATATADSENEKEKKKNKIKIHINNIFKKGIRSEKKKSLQQAIQFHQPKSRAGITLTDDCSSFALALLLGYAFTRLTASS